LFCWSRGGKGSEEVLEKRKNKTTHPPRDFHFDTPNFFHSSSTSSTTTTTAEGRDCHGVSYHIISYIIYLPISLFSVIYQFTDHRSPITHHQLIIHILPPSQTPPASNKECFKCYIRRPASPPLWAVAGLGKASFFAQIHSSCERWERINKYCSACIISAPRQTSLPPPTQTIGGVMLHKPGTASKSGGGTGMVPTPPSVLLVICRISLLRGGCGCGV
jgi:hypothetical protein